MLSHRERLQATIRGEKTDQLPIALWRHFPVDDQSPHRLAAATLNFQRVYDFDLVKVTPSSSHFCKDWGIMDQWEGSHEGTRRYTKWVIQKPGDWEKIPILEPNAPYLAELLSGLRLIRAELGPETPMLQTIFSPLAQAAYLVGKANIVTHIRLYPEAVLKGLETIAETSKRFIEAMLTDKNISLDGIFYSVQQAQASLLTPDEYDIYGLPFDKRSIEPAAELWCNLLHLHGQDLYFEDVISDDALGAYFPIVNWHDRETPPTLEIARTQTKHVFCGGLSRQTMNLGTPEDIKREAEEALAQTKGINFILGTGCVVPITAPHGNLIAAKEIASTRGK